MNKQNKRSANKFEPMVDIGNRDVKVYVPLKDYLRIIENAIVFRQEWAGSGKGDDGTDYRNIYIENFALNLPPLQIMRKDLLMAQAVAIKLTNE